MKYFMNRLRTLSILLVIVLHSAVNYSESAEFWYYKDNFIGPALDFWLYILDIVLMPLLFFIAGYFTYSSYKKRNKKSFYVTKIKKLLVPWILVTFLFLPNLDYLAYTFNKIGDLGYLNYLLSSWRSIITPFTGELTMDRFIPITEQYYQRYMWFLTLLFLFYTIYPLINRVIHANKLSLAKHTLITGILFFITFGLLGFGLGWYSLLNIIQLQPSKGILYLSLFILGDISYKKGVFEKKGLTSKNWYIVLITCVSFVFAFGTTIAMSKAPTITMIHRLVFSTSYTIVTIFSVVLFLNIGFKKWNREKSIFNSISKGSFSYYIIHYFWVVALPLIISPLTIPTGIKLLITVTGGITATILSSKIYYYIKK